jgi:CubicO group peptidase (beta-lactamase class C family)
MLGMSRKQHPVFRVIFALFLLLALSATGYAGQTTTSHASSPAQAQPGDFSQVDSIVKDLMALYDVPGVAIGLVKDGKVVYTKGYGVRNTQTGQPVTEDTLFAIGSVTKSFTALDIAQLVDEGKLDLDAPVITYLPDFKLSDPEATRQVTLRQFLSHSSGLPGVDTWYTVGVKDRKQIIDDMASTKLTAPPGKVWQYSNEGFVLPGYVLEQITGQSWEDYTKQHIFQPLGMTGANFDVAESQKSPNYASPHALDVLKGMQPIPFFPYTKMTPAGPAGGINATVVDMSKYAAFQVGDGMVSSVGVTESTRLVSKEMLDTMHEQQIAIGGSPVTTDQPNVQTSGQQTQTITPISVPLPTNFGYGLGWITEDYHGHKLVAHNGAIDGFGSYVTLVPSEKDGVVLLTNSQYLLRGGFFLEAARLQLVNWLLGVQSEPGLTDAINKQGGLDPVAFNARLQAARSYEPDQAALNALAGDYPSVLGTLTVTAGDGRLYMSSQGQPLRIELVPFEPGGFLINYFAAAGSVISFKTDPNGTITIYQDGAQIAQRLGKDVKSTQYNDPRGRFAATIPPGLTVSQQGDLAVLQSANPPGVFILTARPAGNNNLQDDVTAFLKSLDPTFNQQPTDVQPLPSINEVAWTQYIYRVPGDQVVAVVATQQNGTTYFVFAQAKSADAQALSPTFQTLLLGFQIGQGTAGQAQMPTPVATPAASPGMPRTGTGESGEAAVLPALASLAALILLAGLAIRRTASRREISR